MKKSTVALIVVLGTIGVLAVAGIVAALGYFAVHGISSRAASEAEKQLVVDAEALVPYGAEVDPKCGKYTTTRNLDATMAIEYECETDSLYIQSTAEVNPNVRDARQSFLIAMGAYKAGVAIGDGTLERRDSLLDLGDDSYAAMVRAGDRNAGNVFVVRQGRVVYSIMITGLYFDEAEPVEELIAPLLEAGTKQYGTARKKR